MRAIYQYINYMNVIIDKIDDMEGENYMKEQVKAEAHIHEGLYAWLQSIFMLNNMMKLRQQKREELLM